MHLSILALKALVTTSQFAVWAVTGTNPDVEGAEASAEVLIDANGGTAGGTVAITLDFDVADQTVSELLLFGPADASTAVGDTSTREVCTT